MSTVLFPGSPLPLHIFESRYREMIGQCLETRERLFAVMLIKEGDEVLERPLPDAPPGTPAIPHDIGTLARIVDAVQFEDGRYQLVCVGVQRVRIARLLQQQPYLTGELESVADPDAQSVSDDLRELSEQVRGATLRLLGAIEEALPLARREQRRRVRQVVDGVPMVPAELSFFVPRTLSVASVDEKQALLVAASVRERLRMELPLLLREQRLLTDLKSLGAPPPDSGSIDFGVGGSGTGGRRPRSNQPWRLN